MTRDTAERPAGKPAAAVLEHAPARRIKDIPGRGAVAVWQGFVGSVLMMLGGFGVGWTTLDSPIIRLPFLAWLRTSVPMLILCITILAIGGILMVRAWLRLGQRVKDWQLVDRRVLYKVTVLWSLPLMFTFPLFSRDVYAYIGQGRLMVAGIDPYKNGISSLTGYFSFGADTLWTEAPTPYGPVFLWIEQAVVWITGGDFRSNGMLELAVFLFRVVTAAGVLLCAYYLSKLADHFRFNASRSLWLAVANPLFVINFVASVHNDALMLGFALGGIYLALTRRPILGIVLLTISIAIKPITLVALPFIGLIWAGKGASWGRRIACWTGSVAIAGGLLALMGWLNGFWFGWIPAMSTPGTLWIWYAPVGLVSVGLGYLIGFVNEPAGQVVSSVIRGVAQLAGLAVAVWFILRGKHEAILWRMAMAFTAVVLSAPMIQPWYVLWLMVFFTAAGIDEDWHVKVMYLLTVFFTVIALTDQLNFFGWLPGFNWMPQWGVHAVAITASVGFSLYIMFWDRKTKDLFDWRPHLRRTAKPVKSS
ncbi:polyprenol phosphomannose-dependent alpha 1,6 mannosyltransferase MptB [Acaricomes phytoseiuli]|uniref:polyprenol phosphomannose-dependent alpha 1,6 mannosyltransferase MptB n=1 Tax=Acaricomes phytoseiuli TaxID=291968 RepID=UPI0022219EE7|nr:polyprenol phosphomannose-dependent alpha 1,6 mannosyltransferase MptB [Acaricomes phytoseiuli]MCW1250199.1 polyprenol phosphomannose-dependent alpha 1,6 mannosyltransferase MptB [Acaricomes phytoseiuli]